jgi:glycosyltransferase involved in cell wall biosynthesis
LIGIAPVAKQKKMQQKTANFSDFISVSFVIPVRDEAATLPVLLDDIAAQTFQADEILFVDGGSLDDTLKLLRQAQAQNARLHVIEVAEASPGKGRNIGISAARNEWIALTDAGIRLEKDWLENLLKAAVGDSSVKVVYGNYEPITETLFEKCAALTYVAAKQGRGKGLMRAPSTASMLLHREVWQAVGGFPDSRAAEDLIFFERIAKQNFKTAWSPQATVWWQLRPTLAETFKKFTLYSKHNVWIGRQWDWHHALARQYLVWFFCIMFAVIFRFWWLALLPVFGLLARITKTIWTRREGKSVVEIFHPLTFFLVGVILLTIDAATFLGWVQAYLQRRSRPAASSFYKQNVP